MPIPAPAPAERPDEPADGIGVWLGVDDVGVVDAEAEVGCSLRLVVSDASEAETEAADCDAKAAAVSTDQYDAVAVLPELVDMLVVLPSRGSTKKKGPAVQFPLPQVTTLFPQLSRTIPPFLVPSEQSQPAVSAVQNGDIPGAIFEHPFQNTLSQYCRLR